MITHDIDANSHGTTSLQKLLFSKKASLGSSIVSALLILMAAVLARRAESFEKIAPLVVLAVVSVAAALMLWLRNRYAIYAWALVPSIAAAATILLSDRSRHDFLYWAERVGYSLILIAIAFWLFTIGRRVGDRGQ